MSYWYWTVRVIVRVKMDQARYLVEVTVLAALERKRWMPQVEMEMAVHLLARDVLKRFEGRSGIPAHDHAHERRVRRGRSRLRWPHAEGGSAAEWSASQ